jgi:ribosome maturation factor RimP
LDLHVRPDRTVAVTLDCERKPVTLGSCTFMNRRLRTALAGAGLPADHYAIEVSSPGTKRPLRTPRHFERFEGEPIRIVLPGADGGREVLRGQLVGVSPEGIRFEPRHGERRTIPFTEIREARLDPYQDEECD